MTSSGYDRTVVIGLGLAASIIFGLILARSGERRLEIDAAAPVVQTCVSHPVTRTVVVQ